MQLQSCTALTLCALLLLALTACSKPLQPMQPENPMVTPEELVGNWVDTQSNATLSIYKNNRFLWQTASSTSSQSPDKLRGSITATDTQVRFIYDPDMPVCVDTIGIYTYTLYEGELSLASLNDPCNSRISIIQTVFQYQPNTPLPPRAEDDDPTESPRDESAADEVIIISEDIPDPDPLEPADAPGHDIPVND